MTKQAMRMLIERLNSESDDVIGQRNTFQYSTCFDIIDDITYHDKVNTKPLQPRLLERSTVLKPKALNLAVSSYRNTLVCLNVTYYHIESAGRVDNEELQVVSEKTSKMTVSVDMTGLMVKSAIMAHLHLEGGFGQWIVTVTSSTEGDTAASVIRLPASKKPISTVLAQLPGKAEVHVRVLRKEDVRREMYI